MLSITRLRALSLVLALGAASCGGADVPVAGGPGTDTSPMASSSLPRLRSATADATTTTAKQARTVTLTFTGDLLLHNRVNELAAGHGSKNPGREYDYRPLLEPIRPLIEEADWAICHLEVNLSADNQGLEPFPMFRSPGQIAYDVRDLGYDSCSVASNHILDQGREGVAETLEVLERAGLRYTGAAHSAAEAANQIWIEIGDMRIAHLAYSYGFNGFTVPTDAPWLTNIIDETDILADAAEARAGGADVVMLSLHWGEQYVTSPNWQQRGVGPRLLASPDIDLIVGHHAHVVQPIAHIDGEWLIYGLGNLLANYSQAARRDELLVQITMTVKPDEPISSSVRAVPLYVDRDTLTVYPTNPLTRLSVIDPALTAELDASWTRVQAALQTGSGWDLIEVG